jgi:NADH:ubiquinone oxidoreductase subunit 6 (subunit J)
MTMFAQITDAADGETLLGLLRASWPLVATAALGLASVYLLLPRPQRRVPVVGGLLAALTLLAGARWLTHYDGAWQERFLFYSFSLLALLGGISMLAQSNPVRAALSFALVVLSTCGLFLLLAAPFLMAATVIIYAGAIVVTFLFVIMLAQQAGLAGADARSREPFLASIAGFVLVGCLWITLDRTYDAEPLVRQLEQASRAETFADIVTLWGEPAKQSGAKVLPVVEPMRERFPEDLVLNLEAAWARRDLDDVKKQAARLHAHARETAHERGRLTLPEGAAKPPPRLPAENVAALGRTLFTDYLVPVEMAGVLLLVATIGAIVIASRRGERGEGLR